MKVATTRSRLFRTRAAGARLAGCAVAAGMCCGLVSWSFAQNTPVSITPPSAGGSEIAAELPQGMWEVERTARVGGPQAERELRVSVLAERTRLTPADTLRVRVVVDAPIGTKVNTPDYAKSFGEDLTVLSSITRREHRGQPARQIITTELVIAPFLPGQREIPSWTISSSPDRSGAPPLRVRTESITLTVESTLPEDGSLPELRARPGGETLGDAGGALQSSADWRLYGAIGAGGLLIAGAVTLAIARRRRAHDPDPLDECLRSISNADERARAAVDSGALRAACADAALSLRVLLERAGVNGATALTAGEVEHALEARAQYEPPLRARLCEAGVLGELEATMYSPMPVRLEQVRAIFDRARACAHDIERVRRLDGDARRPEGRA